VYGPPPVTLYFLKNSSLGPGGAQTPIAHTKLIKKDYVRLLLTLILRVEEVVVAESNSEQGYNQQVDDALHVSVKSHNIYINTQTK
jgi:hypothetical protein